MTQLGVPVPEPGIPALIEGVERVRQLLCGYAGQPTCDCKFGACGRGEQTGCPELRQVIDFLRSVRARGVGASHKREQR